MNCYRVKVKTTDPFLANKSRTATGGYLDCRDGELYVVANNFADVFVVVEQSVVESIECLGPGYTVPEWDEG